MIQPAQCQCARTPPLHNAQKITQHDSDPILSKLVTHNFFTIYFIPNSSRTFETQPENQQFKKNSTSTTSIRSQLESFARSPRPPGFLRVGCDAASERHGGGHWPSVGNYMRERCNVRQDGMGLLCHAGDSKDSENSNDSKLAQTENHIRKKYTKETLILYIETKNLHRDIELNVIQLYIETKNLHRDIESVSYL